MFISVHTSGGDALDPKIINGRPIPSSTSPIVKVRYNWAGRSFICTGTILSNKAVLTASHCVRNEPRALTVNIAGKIFAVRKVRIHPDRNLYPVARVIYNDVAILILSKPTTKVPLPILTSQKPRSGELVKIFGYGLNNSKKTGILAEGVTEVLRVRNDFILTIFANSNQSDTCTGDSGSPALYSYTTGSGELRTGIVGTTSDGTSATCSIGDITYYINTATPVVLNFIKQFVRGLKVN